MNINKLKSLKESILEENTSVDESYNIADIFNQGRQHQNDLGDLMLTISADVGLVQNEFLNIDEYTSNDLIKAFESAYEDIPNTKVSGTFHKGGLR